MKRTVFIHVTAWWVVLILLYGLLLWQIALVTAAGILTGLLQAGLLAVLLYLVFTSHHLARRAVQMWAFFMLIFPAAFKLVSKLLIAKGSLDPNPGIGNFSVQLVDLAIGTALLAMATWSMESVEDDSSDPSTHHNQ